MISQIFVVVSDVVTQFASTLASAFQGVLAIVWDGQALTTFGILLLIAFGIGLVYMAMRYVFSLVSIRRGK